MIDRRREDLGQRLDALRRADGWHPFQDFVVGLLHHDGYLDIRPSNPRSDYGRDAVATTPDGKRCVVAVSFECTRSKVLKDAERSQSDPNREKAEVLLFITADAPTATTWSAWKADVAALGLELRMFHREKILQVATRDGVWRETCARLGISGDRAGYRLIEPYDSGRVRAALEARPAEWLGRLIPLSEWRGLSVEVQNRIVLGKPGAGKTTTLLFHLEQARPDRVLVVERDITSDKVEDLLDHASGGGVIVFDNADKKAGELSALLSALRARQVDVPEVSARYRNVRLLVAARSQEWTTVQHQLPVAEMQDLGLLGESQVQLGALSTAQCRELVDACRDAWGLVLEPRLLEQAAAAAAARDATPLYVLSMLAPARAREDRTLRDEHLAHLPPGVLDLWKFYWTTRLSPVQQGVLRVVKLFAVTLAPPDPSLFDLAMRAFELPLYELSAGLDHLERALWISREGAVPTCLDVQKEAIDLDQSWMGRWDQFVRDVAAEAGLKAQLHLGTGFYHLVTRARRMPDQAHRAAALQAAERHFEALSVLAGDANPPLRALALHNLAACNTERAGLETTRDARTAWLDKAVTALEEAVTINRELDAWVPLADALNSLSQGYLSLARLESTREGGAALLREALAAIEEAAAIHRERHLWSNLASSLTNRSNVCADLARLEGTRDGQASWIAKGAGALEEAVAIRRELGLREGLADSLNNLSIEFAAQAALEDGLEARRSLLQRAVAASEQAVAIHRELGLQGNLAMALTTLSDRFKELAQQEATREGGVVWLGKAVAAAEQAVEIRRRLGLHGDLARSLNTVSDRYAELAELETTDAGRRAALQKAVAALETALAIRRPLGLEGDLARSLTHLSARYGALAWMETSLKDAAARRQEAVAAGEEAVEISRRLVIPGELGAALGNLSNAYGAMAVLERTPAGRALWLQKAVLASEEAVAIHRGIGVARGLGLSLGSLARHLSLRAHDARDSSARIAGFRAARASAQEASRLFEASGDVRMYVMSLEDVVKASGMLWREGDAVDLAAVRRLCERGRQLAQAMQLRDLVEFFEGALAEFRKG
jgi:tetratricopeptide (TPR) repeat protein